MNTPNEIPGPEGPSSKKFPKRLHGTVVADRLHRDVYALVQLVDTYLQRRRPDDEDAITKEVFDALLDAEQILAELQGLVDALESRLYPLQRDVFAEARALKEAKAAERNPQRQPYEPIRYRVAPHVLRQADA